ncbi:MAG: DUF1028 domain-containing protein [Candidatus Eisenbacteria bacterium]|uniref:DUF1028 domain-containing protein n=1 Tax=Eiseniibacteriota bacterium TaxID=2212470 RepID=A0A538TNI6_UNCEI|nr:MAG: DUF1028 domain-containing protein [Candidatus Eisenbacteria bacterium]
MRRTVRALFLSVLLALPASAEATFSIVARDSATGDIGVAVQSHYFAVGPIVPWAEPGIGAVATQSLVEVSYGPKGLELMRNGKDAKQALHDLLEEDPHPEVRQVAMVDARGEVASHTGAKCIPDAGDTTGNGYSVQANLMSTNRVWPAMARAYERSNGDLAERLLAALEAGQLAGGDIRGQQSAAIVIVKGKRSNKPWADRIMDLRVEDSPKPIAELRRLVTLWRAYRNVDDGDALVTDGKVEDAMKAYSEAARLAPGNDEILFWQAVTLWKLGREKDATPIFRKVFARGGRRWVELVPRLVPAGLLEDDPASLRRIQALAARAKRAR